MPVIGTASSPEQAPALHAAGCWALRSCCWFSALIGMLVYFSITYSSIGLILLEIAGFWTFYALTLPLALWLFGGLLLFFFALAPGVKGTSLGEIGRNALDIKGLNVEWAVAERASETLGCAAGSCRGRKFPDGVCLPHPCTLWMCMLFVVIAWQSWAYTPLTAAPQNIADWRALIEEAVPGTSLDDLPSAWRNALDDGWNSNAYFGANPYRGPYGSNRTDQVSTGPEDAQYFIPFMPAEAPDENPAAIPAVILVHGGTNVESANAGGYRAFANQLASVGIAAFSVEYRSKARDDGDFFDSAADVRAAIAQIKRECSLGVWRAGKDGSGPPVSPDQLFVMGGSRGGHLSVTCALAGMNNNSYWQEKAGNFSSFELSVAGVLDVFGAVLPYYDDELSPRLVPLDEAILGGPRDENEETWKMATASFLFGSNNPPILIMQGMLDLLVEPDVSQRFSKDCEDANVPFTALLEYPQGQHGYEFLTFSPGGVLSFHATLDWIGRVLQKLP